VLEATDEQVADRSEQERPTCRVEPVAADRLRGGVAELEGDDQNDSSASSANSRSSAHMLRASMKLVIEASTISAW